MARWVYVSVTWHTGMSTDHDTAFATSYVNYRVIKTHIDWEGNSTNNFSEKEVLKMTWIYTRNSYDIDII